MTDQTMTQTQTDQTRRGDQTMTDQTQTRPETPWYADPSTIAYHRTQGPRTLGDIMTDQTRRGDQTMTQTEPETQTLTLSPETGRFPIVRDKRTGRYFLLCKQTRTVYASNGTPHAMGPESVYDETGSRVDCLTHWVFGRPVPVSSGPFSDPVPAGSPD